MLRNTRNTRFMGTFAFASTIALGLFAASAGAAPLAGMGLEKLTKYNPEVVTAESRGEARLWLVQEFAAEMSGPENSAADNSASNSDSVGSSSSGLTDGGDSFRQIRPTRQGRKRTNFGSGPLAQTPGNNQLDPRRIRLLPRTATNGVAQPIQVPGLARLAPQQLPVTANNAVARGVQFTNTGLQRRAAPVLNTNTVRIGNTRTATARRTASNSTAGGGSRTCGKMITVVVDGTPMRVRVNAPGGC